MSNKMTKSHDTTPSSKITVLLSDIHFPEHDKPAMGAVYSFLKTNKDLIANVVLLGDNLDMQNISRHTEGLPRLRARGGLLKDFATFNKEIIQVIESTVKPGTKKIFFLGNHEDWFEQWLDKHPEFEGLVSVDKCLGLSKKGWDVVPQGDHRTIGKVYLVHGDQVGAGESAAKKMVNAFSANCIMGHGHGYYAYTKTSAVKPENKWLGVMLPCLCTLSPRYAKGRPNSWINGFGIIEEWPNKFVNIYVPIILNGQFYFGGKLYKGN